MKRLLLVVLIMLSPSLYAAKETFDVSAADPEMNNAIKKAQETIGSFWKHYNKPGPNEKDFMIKVKIEDAGGVEHFWCGNIQLKDGAVYGDLWNYPEVVKSVKYGETVKIDPTAISDWMYYRDGKIVGGFTIRVLLKYLDEGERKRYENMLGPEE
ncbi:MAG TPA: DUF2314 domain-containing protein [Spirochaetota bacterium]|nr:DUF2314 domain-containing protein [Spirochaetota bacterium]HQO39312.1 DUF2314 domain-containing protein [Spirochaetota bacterium]